MEPDLFTPTTIRCPYCGEWVEVVIERDLMGEMVHDCEVCCNPWRLTITRKGSGRRVEAARLDD